MFGIPIALFCDDVVKRFELQFKKFKGLKYMAGLPIESSSQIQADYMKLLITQLQNQNPLEPLDNQEMASQLAQFSQLQQIETMNKSFSEFLSLSNHNYANSLLGRNITFYERDTSTGALLQCQGRVESVLNNQQTDEIALQVLTDEGGDLQEHFVGLGSVVRVEE